MRIREAIHGDLDFNEIEEKIIRHPIFQRLHRIRQLGTAYCAYPSAVHTRFEHSLGTCHIAKTLISVLERHGHTFTAEEKAVIPIAALLHDITHTPFAHALQDELDLFERHGTRDKYLRRLEELNLANLAGPELFDMVLDILPAKSFEAIASPYQSQIIQDTVCADLLDYIVRDLQFTGIRRRYDERILDHLRIVDYRASKHLAIEIGQRETEAPSIVTEFRHLLDIRYTLSERVYLYHTKIAADAMLGKALRLLIAKQGFDEQDLYDQTDEGLINFPANQDDPDVKYLGMRLKHRDLFRRAFVLRRDDERMNQTIFSHMVSTFRGRTNLERWAKTEQGLAEASGISPRDVIVYCHEPECNLKVAKILAYEEYGSTPKPILEFSEYPEIKQVATMHERLWRLHVFSGDPDASKKAKLQEASKEILLTRKFLQL